MSWSRRQAGIAGEELSLERLSQSDIRGVISRHVRSELPNARQQDIMWIPVDRNVGKISQCLSSAFRVHLARGTVATHDLSHFQIEKMRSVQGFLRRKNALLDLQSGFAPKKDFKQC